MRSTILAKAFVLGLIALAALVGCAREDGGLTVLEGATMGTTYRVTHARTGSSDADEQQAIDALLQEINASLSTYIETSLISRINASSDTSLRHPIDSHFQEVFDRSRFVFVDTRGAFNPAVGPLVNAWGFGSDKTPATPDRATLDSLVALVDFDSFIRHDQPASVQKTIAGARLDFSAIAKGYGVDAVGRLLEARGVSDYFAEIGGEVRTRGQHPDGRPWNVGIERPAADAAADRSPQIVVHLADAALATSGNYRNYYDRDGQRYVHIINPKTGLPRNSSLLSVSVLAEDCMTADAYATAFMVMGREDAMAFVKSAPERGMEFQAYFITADSSGNFVEDRWPPESFR